MKASIRCSRGIAGSVTEGGATGRSGGCGTFGSRAGAAGSCTTASGAGTVASDDSGDGGGAGVAHAHSATDSVNTGRTAAGRRIIGARLARTPRAMDFPRVNDAQRV